MSINAVVFSTGKLRIQENGRIGQHRRFFAPFYGLGGSYGDRQATS
jgi:hypothetical protein